MIMPMDYEKKDLGDEILNRMKSYLGERHAPDTNWAAVAETRLLQQVKRADTITDAVLQITTGSVEQGKRYLTLGERLCYESLRMLKSTTAKSYLQKKRNAIAQRSLDDAINVHDVAYFENHQLLDKHRGQEETLERERDGLYTILADLGKQYRGHKEAANKIEQQAKEAQAPEQGPLPLKSRKDIDKELNASRMVGGAVRAHNLILSYVNSRYETTRALVRFQDNLELALIDQQQIMRVFREYQFEHDTTGVTQRCVGMLRKYGKLVERMQEFHVATDKAASDLAQLSNQPISELGNANDARANEQHERLDVIQHELDLSVEEILEKREQEYRGI